VTQDECKTILDMSEAAGFPGVYVLGSFARYVTLYSQQVRALNLIAALRLAERIREDTDVAVIGGGAAGLMAAAAAATGKAKVVLLEELEGVLELQRNNRQRWIHPHIYDWPDMEFDSEDAKLPLLNWQAGYAETVARQIEEAWDDIGRRTPITVHTQATDISLSPDLEHTKLSWTAPKGGSAPRKFPVIILAVGFGLEPESDYEYSYWSEDDLDGSFRRDAQPQRWLVSGSGDGALTDLMRLCIRRFRHAEIKDMFSSVPGYLGVIDSLREIHEKHTHSDRDLSDAFSRLSVGQLQEKLGTRLRTGSKVFLTAKTPDLYGNGASILNRLIVLLLFQLGRVGWRPGPFDEVKQKKGDQYEVILGGRNEMYHRVILRHGPKPSLERVLPDVWEACTDLRSKWKNLARPDDISRKRLWAPETFPEIRFTAAGDSLKAAFNEAVQSVGIRAGAMTIRKELRGDGSSTVRFEFDQLSVEDGELQGIRIYYESTTGQVGPLKLDPSADRLGIKLLDDYAPPPEVTDTLDLIRDRARKLSIVLQLPRAWRPSHPPLRFGVSFTVLNGDALSTWEFEQMYSQSDRVHMDGSTLPSAVEYLARAVWFPIENLRIRITLPDRSPGPPLPSLLALPEANRIPRNEIIRDGILGLYPSNTSKWRLDSPEWERQPQIDSGRLTSPSAQTWDLSIHRPAVGS
jgi:hypothetical protein